MKQGGEHWQWSPETPFYIGLLPRYGAKSSDIKVSNGRMESNFPLLLMSHSQNIVVHL